MNSTRLTFTAPFPTDYRASGVLLHVTSLPSRYGIGDAGPRAFDWVDTLATAAQSWWQVLPLGPTGFGNSPYQALSSFAANPLIISPEKLVEDGLISEGDCGDGFFPSDYVDFDKIVAFKEKIVAGAWRNFQRCAPAQLRCSFEKFCDEKADLQEDTALFMSLRTRFRKVPFWEWPEELALREPKSIEKARRDLAESIDQFRFGQFIVLRQWAKLKEYANQRGVKLLGDLPIFVSPDSADVWANPELFLLDKYLRPTVVAGVPPDYFSADGQLWGNPIYDWEAHRHRGFQWWIKRLQARLDYLDVIRVDHFRGFEAAWHVPAGAPTAASGQWVPGPGADFFTQIREALDGLPLLAEDLGLIMPAVTALRDQFQLPGMRVLQFAFNGDADNPHLPNRGVHNSVIYTGTHDNDTTRGWYDSCSPHERAVFLRYVARPETGPDEAAWEMIRLAWSSEAALAVAPLQDLLSLRSDARMNIPGRSVGQWRWRCSDEALADPAWKQLFELTRATHRVS